MKQNYSLDDVALMLRRTRQQVVGLIARGFLDASVMRGWPEPRVSRIAFVEFAIVYGFRLPATFRVWQ